MTDAELNRALAQKLEPLESIDRHAWIESRNIFFSPRGLWWKGEGLRLPHECYPEDFHDDGSAMLVLIEAMLARRWRYFFEQSTDGRLRRAVFYLLEPPISVDTPRERAQHATEFHEATADTFPRAVALAAAEALGIEVEPNS